MEVCQAHNVRVCGLAAYHNVNLLAQQARQFSPEKICIFREDKYQELKELTAGLPVEILTGMDGLLELAAMDSAEMVLNAVVGMIGLQPTLAAIAAGKEIALANKETLVTGGSLVMAAAREKGVPVYPVDSEHSAIFQCLQGNEGNRVRRVLLTASGGPFFGRSREQLRGVTVEQALRHPNWSMGAKITIDSATLMNKGLEFIEAMWLFGLKPEQIEIVVHRESVIHSAVEFEDHSVIAQMGVPDMKIPIQYALTYPRRIDCPVQPLSLTDYGTLSFARPDPDTFVCLKACMEAAARGGLFPAAVNGANEQAVALFLDRKITFLEIGELVRGVLDCVPAEHNVTVDDIINIDQTARRLVLEQAGQRA